MSDDDESDSTEGQPPRDRVGLIGGVVELAAQAFGVVARIFVR